MKDIREAVSAFLFIAALFLFVALPVAKAADQVVPHTRLDGKQDTITIEEGDGVIWQSCESIPAKELIEGAPDSVCLLRCHGTQDGQPGGLVLPFACEEEV